MVFVHELPVVADPGRETLADSSSAGIGARAENPHKSADLASTRPAVLVERGRGRKQALTRAHPWVESILVGRAPAGSAREQPNPAA